MTANHKDTVRQPSSPRIPLPQAAYRARMSADRMRRKLLSGEIAGEFLHGRWLVDADALAKWMALHDVTASDE